jgi:anti-sigma regulatory factor (Ser/Thr protein kinase)
LTTVAELLASEIATNSIVHSRSGQPGGRIAVKVTPVERAVRVQVRDQGSTGSIPRLRSGTNPAAEHGHGLVLVDTLASRWGTKPTGDGGRIVWFELAVPDDDG